MNYSINVLKWISVATSDHLSWCPGAIFTISPDLRLDLRLGLDMDRVSLETRSGTSEVVFTKENHGDSVKSRLYMT